MASMSTPIDDPIDPATPAVVLFLLAAEAAASQTDNPDLYPMAEQVAARATQSATPEHSPSAEVPDPTDGEANPAHQDTPSRSGGPTTHSHRGRRRGLLSKAGS